ncbi:hypothetical protein M3223_04015 [Paenibacillus pasadenensis]|uniref:hypothetical protein n=1 Tax=Paenibacillus pasadenensis TaxID=217090 RepID=UPI00203CF0FE|nr:hypothetical protein [Paenibacillus pasadenensis]MCM3746514.1 hypothetical protein [Paenibacillus pasadenensis]
MPFASSGGGGRGFARFNAAQKKKAEDELDFEKLQNQINNAKLRIEDSGKKVEDSDQRNWLEKSLNLPQKQNVLFDVLDVLGRPMQAVEGAIIGAQTGENSLSNAWKGFSGKEKYSGQDIVENMGVQNKYAKGLLGFGIDMVADPLTYVPGGVLLKGAKAAAAPAVAGAKLGYKAAEKIPAFGRLSENVLKPAAENAKDALGNMFVPRYGIDRTLGGGTDDTLGSLYQQTENARRYMQDQSFRGVVDAVQKAGGVDAGTDVGRIMEAPLKQFEDVPGFELPSGEFVKDRRAVLDQLQGQKSALRDAGADLGKKTKDYKRAELELAGGLNQTNDKLRSLYERVARTAGSEVERNHARNVVEATKEISRIDSQLTGLDKAQDALLKRYKKEFRDNHGAQFDLLKQVRQFAPAGIRLTDYDVSALPKSLQGIVRDGGRNIDELADEMGYTSGDELLQELEHVARQPKKMDDATLGDMAARRAEREGAFEHFDEQRAALAAARETLQQSLQGLADKDMAAMAEEGIVSAVARHPNYAGLTDQRRTLEEQLGSLRTERDATLSAGREGVRSLQDSIDQLRAAADNQVVQTQPAERAARELSQDAGIQSAARSLIEFNQTIRDYAREAGIEISELEGYMKHTLSQAEREARAKGIGQAVKVDQGRFGAAQPSKKVLAQRELTGSVEDINERLGREFFEPNAFFASAQGQRQLIDYIHAVKLRREVLNNPNYARKIEKGEKVTPGRGEIIIDSNNYTFLRQGENALADADGLPLTYEVGGQYLVTKAAKGLLDRYQQLTTDEGMNAFLKGYDAMMNGWKKLALASPNYVIRNAAGALAQNYLAGMTNPASLVKYTKQAMSEVEKAGREGGKRSEMLDEFYRQGLGGGQTSAEFLNSADPAKALNKEVEKASSSRLKRYTPIVGNPIRNAAEFSDATNKYALYKWARTKGLSPEQAAAKVRQAHFDYQDITPAERQIFARVIPFYRWMRNNIPFQVANFAMHPARYAALEKARDNAIEMQGMDDSNTPDYMKESFAVPISGDGGKGYMLGLNLPIGDLTKLSNPIKMITDSFAEPITLPIELATNRDFFRNKDIEKFAGQTTNYGIPGLGEIGLDPKLAYAMESLGGQPVRAVSSLTKVPDSSDMERQYLNPSLGLALPIKPYDYEKFQFYNQLDELKKLQEYIQYLKANDVEIRDVREIQR